MLNTVSSWIVVCGLTERARLRHQGRYDITLFIYRAAPRHQADSVMALPRYLVTDEDAGPWFQALLEGRAAATRPAR
jgi:hypothetical protein